MKVNFLGVKGTWREVANAARTTIHQEAGNGEPSSNWKRRMLFAEHSPIRQIIIKWKWLDIPYWVSVHLVRHWLGIIHWVRTQRTDRTGIKRDEKPQGSFIEHEAEANAQAIINISRRRLCRQASKETRIAWKTFLESIKNKEPELYSVCVPECIYRNGLCPEYESCGWNQTKEFDSELNKYLFEMRERIGYYYKLTHEMYEQGRFDQQMDSLYKGD